MTTSAPGWTCPRAASAPPGPGPCNGSPRRGRWPRYCTATPRAGDDETPGSTRWGGFPMTTPEARDAELFPERAQAMRGRGEPPSAAELAAAGPARDRVGTTDPWDL